MPEEIGYITGAVIKYEKLNEEQNEISIYDHDETYFCSKSVQLKVGQGYKFGVKEILPIPTTLDGKKIRRFEIVSIEQVILKNPAFEIKSQPAISGQPTVSGQPIQTMAQVKVVQMPFEDYKELVSQKSVRIKENCLKAAIEICRDEGSIYANVDALKRGVVRIATELEQYF